MYSVSWVFFGGKLTAAIFTDEHIPPIAYVQHDGFHKQTHPAVLNQRYAEL